MVDFQVQDVAMAAGKVLRQLRKKAGLSQEKLSFKATIQRNFVSEIELGQKQPSLFTVFKLARALDVLPQQFVQLVFEQCNTASLQDVNSKMRTPKVGSP